MIRIILLICGAFLMNAQSVSSTRKLFVPLQRSFDIILSSNTFHTANVEETFGFDLGVSHQFVEFPDFEDLLHIDNKKVDMINMRTIRAGIDLPIHIQFGMHLTLPSYKLRDFNTNLLGYYLKVQIDQWISDAIPYTALQFNSSQIEIGTFLTSKTDSYQLQFSSKILFIHLYGGMMMNYNMTEFKAREFENAISAERREFYYRVGVNLELFFLNVFAETMINEERDYQNLTVGISLKI